MGMMEFGIKLFGFVKIDCKELIKLTALISGFFMLKK